MRTFWFCTVRINVQRVIVDGKSKVGGDFFLARLDGRIMELFHMAALQTHNMVVVLALIKFKHRLSAFKIVSHQQPSVLELGQHAVYRSQSNVPPACR